MKEIGLKLKKRINVYKCERIYIPLEEFKNNFGDMIEITSEENCYIIKKEYFFKAKNKNQAYDILEGMGFFNDKKVKSYIKWAEFEEELYFE